MQRVGQHVMLDLRLAAVPRTCSACRSPFFDRNPVGRLMTRVTNDVDVLNELFTAGVVALFGDLFTLVGIVIAMAQLNVELLAVTFSVLPLIVDRHADVPRQGAPRRSATCAPGSRA